MMLLLASLTVAATSVLAPAQFAPAQGWHVGTGKARACVGVSAERCTETWSWTSTVRWRDCRHCAPHKTLAVLQRDGVVITVTRVRERPIVAKRQISWPPRIAARDVTAGVEGIPGRYGVYQLFARVANRGEVMVWASFLRSRPTTAQLVAANARLGASRLP
jgi:hypothetical protein